MNVLRTERSVSLHRPPSLRGLLHAVTKKSPGVSAHTCFLSRDALYPHHVAHVTLAANRFLGLAQRSRCGLRIPSGFPVHSAGAHR